MTVNERRKARGMRCISVWLAADVKEWVEDQAEEQGMSVAAFVRGIVLCKRRAAKK